MPIWGPDQTPIDTLKPLGLRGLDAREKANTRKIS